MSLFKHAAVRGMAHSLVQRGLINFPSKQAMDDAADAVADAMPLPDLAPEGGHDDANVAAIAQKLMAIADELNAAAGVGGSPADPMPLSASPGAPPSAEAVGAAKEASWLHASATRTGREELALKCATEVMTKAANMGALLTGGDKQNTPAAAAQHESVAALDQKQRPAGAFTGTAGHTAMNTAQGQVGAPATPPVSPSNSPSGSNSLSKAAAEALRNLFKQSNALVGVAAPSATKNSPEAAAAHESVAALDKKNRSPEAYKVPPGGANKAAPAGAQVGMEQSHPHAPSNSPAGTNSVIQVSKAAEVDPEVAALAFLFDKCAADVGPYLPQGYTEEQKVAAIRMMIPLDRAQRQEFITNAHEQMKAASTSVIDAAQAAAATNA